LCRPVRGGIRDDYGGPMTSPCRGGRCGLCRHLPDVLRKHDIPKKEADALGARRCGICGQVARVRCVLGLDDFWVECPLEHQTRVAPRQMTDEDDDTLDVLATDRHGRPVQIATLRAALRTWLVDGLARYAIRTGYPDKLDLDMASQPDVLRWNARTRSALVGYTWIDALSEHGEPAAIGSESHLEAVKEALAGGRIGAARLAVCTVSQAAVEQWSAGLARRARPIGLHVIVPAMVCMPRAFRGAVARCHLGDAEVLLR